MVEKVRTDRAPRTRRCENACQRARRCPLMAATAVWALWTTAEHVSSMARPTTDDNITVYDDAVFCDNERQYGYCPTLRSTFYGFAINFGSSLGDMSGEMAPASRLGRQVNGVAKGYAQSWNLHRLHPDHPCSHPHPYPYTIHTHPICGCEHERSQQAVGSLADHLWLGECSPISITLPLLCEGTTGGSNSDHTKLFLTTIKVMAKP